MKRILYANYLKIIQRIVLSICFLIIAGCGYEKLKRINSDDTILAFGDSLTYGTGAGKDRSYPTVLAQLTGINVVNAGIPGETTSQGVERFQLELDKYSPELVVLLEGGNDILRNHNRLTTRQNLASMIEIALAREIAVVLIGVPEKKLFSDSAPFYQELAEEYELVFDGETLSDLLRSARYKSDPVHLNSSGYQKLAEEIYQLLIAHGALD